MNDNKDIDKDSLMEIILSYNNYIQEANIKDLYSAGWRPMDIVEFYDSFFSKPRTAIELVS